jgi:chromosome segregation ATPase
MATNSLNNAVDLIRQALADLETRRSRLASDLAELEGEVKKHRSALSALTGEATPGRAVTKVQVRDELIELLREHPGQAVPREELEKTLKQRIKKKQIKATNLVRRLDEVLREGDGFEVGDGGFVTLAEGGQRATS